MTLTILSDTDVRTLLHSLSVEDVSRLQQRLASALHEYSTGTQETSGGCSANQPPRTHVSTPDGQTTLFMPARTGETSGVKIVTLAPPAARSPSADKRGPLFDDSAVGASDDDNDDTASAGSANSSSRAKAVAAGGHGPRKGSTGSGASSPRVSTHSLKFALRGAADSKTSDNSNSSALGSSTSSLSTSTATGTTASGRSSPAPPPANAPSLSSLAGAAAQAQTRSTTPQGSLTILRANGEPLALINAAELTAFRTALASTLLFAKRQRVHSIAVFGAGKQAYWHLRLALTLRGADIHHVRLINRTFDGAAPLLRAIYQDPSWDQLRNANNKLGFSLLSADYGEYSRLLKDYVRDADALFCCTPSTTPLFPGGYLTRAEGRRKGRYLSLVGSYAPHMREVDPDILKQAVAPDHGHHYHRHPAQQAGVVVVDGLDACLREAGEIIAAGVSAEQLVELGEIIMVKRAAKKEVEMGKAGEPGLVRWLQSGNVVYKSVGLGLMDLAVGEELVALARERGIGTLVEDF